MPTANLPKSVVDDLSIGAEFAWLNCKVRFTHPTLDTKYVSEMLGLGERKLSKLLHDLKRRSGMKGMSVYICLDNGYVFLASHPNSLLGELS